MIYKLKLALLIISPRSFPNFQPLDCNVTVFDLKSLKVAAIMARSGGFGRWSKSSYYLQGTMTIIVDGDIVETACPLISLFRKETKLSAKGNREMWEINPCLVEVASSVKR